MTPNKPPVEMTIRQLFRNLAQQSEYWSEEQKVEFRKFWLEGAERMRQHDKERLRAKRLRRQRFPF